MTSKKAQQDFDDDGDYDAEDDAGEDESLDEETEEGTRPSVMASDNENKADKTATFDEIRDVIVRTAYFTTDQETKRKLLRMLRADPG